jgi:hypothetical protein
MNISQMENNTFLRRKIQLVLKNGSLGVVVGSTLKGETTRLYILFLFVLVVANINRPFINARQTFIGFVFKLVFVMNL